MGQRNVHPLEVEISILGVQHELLAGLGLDGVADSLDATGEPLEDALDISALLHEDNSRLILFMDPNLIRENISLSKLKCF